MCKLKKKFLIFTGVGDNENQFFSWAKSESNIFDRAINYYGKNNDRLNEILECNPEFHFQSEGMIWDNFVQNYNLFQHYDYVLIVDSDLELDPNELEKTFKLAEKNNWPACQWSRDPNSFGIFVEKYIQKESLNYRKTNYIEMLFMLIRKDLLKKLVNTWAELDLKWGTGVCLVLSNVAMWNKLLPFYIVDDFKFYNPHPYEKTNGREIDLVTETLDHLRMEKLLKIMRNNPSKYKITTDNIQVIS